MQFINLFIGVGAVQFCVHVPIVCRSLQRKLDYSTHRKCARSLVSGLRQTKYLNKRRDSYEKTATLRQPENVLPAPVGWSTAVQKPSIPRDAQTYKRLYTCHDRPCSLIGLPCLGIEPRLAGYALICFMLQTE
jgi:hypothetical protein